jgi:putative MATE family efflux protein
MNLTSDPIPKLVRSIAIPASVGMFFQTMYNFVDTYWAGRVSTEGLAALTFSFPVFFIVIAVGSGLGQATTALLGNALGSGHPERARQFFCQALLLCCIAAVAMTIAGLLGSRWLFEIQNAKGVTLDLALQYMNVIMAGAGFFLLQTVLNAELNARGNTKVYRNALIAGFVLNCILDPWMLYGGWGMPAMGMAGLAWATIVCQVATCLYLMRHVARGPLWREVSKAHFQPAAKEIGQLLTQAVPAGFNMLTVAAGIFVIQSFVARYGDAPVAGYGIATRVEQMLLLPAMGLNYAVLTLVAQNFGAQRFDRIRQTWHTTLRYGLGMMVPAGIVLWFTRHQLVSIFSDVPAVIGHGSDYLGLASFTMAAYVILFQTVFLLQGLKQASISLWVGLYRQIVAPLCVFPLLAVAMDWKQWGVWWGITMVTWSAALVTFAIGRQRTSRLLSSVEPQGA